MKIPIQIQGLEYVIGNASSIERMLVVPRLKPFSDEAVNFLDSLSKILFNAGRGYSDVITFAFWCRRAAIMREARNYSDACVRLGRGIVFHSTPSNVAVNFAFSFATGLLAGNPNIVRLPAKDFEQVRIITSAIKTVLQSQPEMQAYIVFVKYGLIKECSDLFSSICAARIVWGGDMTIKMMRESPLPPRATEITFADRYSLLVIDADAVIPEKDMARCIRDFWNDTFFTDQNACTSPRLVAWVGERKEEAKERFWSAVRELAKKDYKLQPIQAVQKLAAMYRVSLKENVQLVGAEDNYIYRLKVDKLDADLMDYKFNSGFFFEYDATSLDEIFAFTDVKCQTVTYLGFTKDEIRMAVEMTRPHGIDRIVPIGTSMNFNLIWDGYDLIRSLSRVITIE